MDNKPTDEELKSQEDEAIKIAEELEGRQSIPQDEEEEPEIVPDKSSSPDLSAEEDITGDKEDAEPSKELYKNKFKASSREAQKIAAKNRVMNQAIIDAEGIPDPTEEQLQQEFPDWDVMNETERTLAKETVISRSWRQTISQAKEQATKIEKWNESVEQFIDDPKTFLDNPELEGKTEEFQEFATRDENNSVPFHTLVGAFLYEHSRNNKPHKGRMFEKGSGGPNEKPKVKDGKISLDEARRIRETNYSRWKELNDSGKIDYDV